MKRVPSAAELLMPKHLDELGVSWQAEYQFAKAQGRKWRADWAIPAKRVLIECEGAIWTRGRHVRGTGYIADLEKYNAATAMGWKVFRFSSEQICSGYAKQFLAKALTNGHLY